MQELLIFMVVVLLVFGSSRLPSLMRNLGRSANEFKAGMREPVGSGTENLENDNKDS
ncbi:MAG: twin-arginine translocase TatA/TatE family subunit [Planctomycetales bacterium]|nr:twin-arginine translocase TatA/TatE family subunit [Planctomycetales bacterium]